MSCWISRWPACFCPELQAGACCPSQGQAAGACSSQRRPFRSVALRLVRPTPGISCEAPICSASSASSPCWTARDSTSVTNDSRGACLMLPVKLNDHGGALRVTWEDPAKAIRISGPHPLRQPVSSNDFHGRHSYQTTEVGCGDWLPVGTWILLDDSGATASRDLAHISKRTLRLLRRTRNQVVTTHLAAWSAREKDDFLSALRRWSLGHDPVVHVTTRRGAEVLTQFAGFPTRIRELKLQDG